jgi:hypothetical protein
MTEPATTMAQTADYSYEPMETPFARSIAAGTASIQRQRFVHVPNWMKEILADMRIPYIAVAMALLTLISFSFGQFMQNQLYTEAAFTVSYLQIDPAFHGGEWL